MVAETISQIKWRLVLFVVALGCVAVLIARAGGAIVPFVLGLSFAYFVAPLVNRIDRTLRPLAARVPRLDGAVRPLAILITYAVVGAALFGGFRLVTAPLLREAGALAANSDTIVDDAERFVATQVATYEHYIPAEVQAEILSFATRERLTEAALRVWGVVQQALQSTFGAVTRTLGFALAMLVIPFWLFYILNDTGRFMSAMMGLIPHDLRPDVEAVRIICDRVLSGYIRGQVIIAFVLGTLFTLLLVVLDVPYAVTLGVLAGVLAVVPFIGTIVGAGIATLVALVAAGPALAGKTLLGFVVVQQIDNMFISPRVQGKSVALNPGAIIFVLVLGQAVMGPLGLLAAVPLAAIARDIVHYLYLRVGEEPVAPPDALAAVGYAANVTARMRGEPERVDAGVPEAADAAAPVDDAAVAEGAAAAEHAASAEDSPGAKPQTDAAS
ncbi:MAG: AI-2E family transporter [Ardenticatenales bacterium]|jgi:predicted PurR-regulated permease PerM|nr:AI-2E family transporter [Ardenticatenales bacterium]